MRDAIRIPPTIYITIVGALIAALCAVLFWPAQSWDMAGFIAASLLSIAPLVIPGILLAAWIMASGSGAREADTGRIH